MWFRRNKGGVVRDLRDMAYEPPPKPPEVAPPETSEKPPITSKQYHEQVVPEIVRRWEQHCFCKNPHFLKLISFNFENYKIAPMRLTDSDQIISALVLKRFDEVIGWSQTKRGSDDQQRTDRCPQCGITFITRYDQYSINMDRKYSIPEVPLETAAVGQYVAGFFYWAKQEEDLQKIADFKLAESVDAFVHLLTQST
jgi:hypothetical protein